MVLDYYELKEQPFGVTPDPRYNYPSPTHREALASLVYGVNTKRGFMALIAKPGMGKTTLLFQLLRQLEGTAKTVFLFQTLCSPRDFLWGLLADLGIECRSENIVEMNWALNRFVLRESRAGRRLVIVVDEAQNLDSAVLEVVRMLSNFETPREKLVQIILAGQPQLAEKLASPYLVQLRQRISLLARLEQLSLEETRQYINHRLQVAGYSSETPMFDEEALALIAKQSEGIPRNINNLCFNSLSLGCALKRRTIDEEVVDEVLADTELWSLIGNGKEAQPAEAAPGRATASGLSKASVSQYTWGARFAV
jgi:general secretion pathway protein A